MVGKSTHPQAIIEAVHHRIAGTQARSPVGAGSAFIHEVAIGTGEGDIERAACRARGFVRPYYLLLTGRQVTTKGRMLMLVAPAFVFLGKGEQWQIGHSANRFALHAGLSEPGLIESRICPNIVELRSQVFVL